MREIPILILAAGASSRMRGTDKLAEPLAGVPLLTRVVQRAVSTGAPVFVALPPSPHVRDCLVPCGGATILRCPGAAEGLSASLREAVGQLPPCPAFVVLPADMPDVETADLVRILSAWQPNDRILIWRAATQDGKPGHPILFAAALRPQFADLRGDTGGKPVVSAHAAQVSLVYLPGQRARCDLDTPEDWAAYRAAHQTGTKP